MSAGFPGARCCAVVPALRGRGLCRGAGRVTAPGVGGQLRVVRVLGVLEPGGAQLSALRLSAALREHGVATTLLAGDATPPGMALAARYGCPADAFRVSELANPCSLQWTPEPAFADWLGPRLAPADLVHAHMVGAWWAAAQAVPPLVPGRPPAGLGRYRCRD